jgi:hypothetical protein
MNDSNEAQLEKLEEQTKLQFHLEEFRQLRAEVLLRSRIQIQLEVFTVAAVGLLFWFLATNNQILSERPVAARVLAWWSPLLLILAGYVWWRSYVLRNYRIGAYLWQLEERFAAEGLGWEHYLPPGSKRHDGRPRRIPRARNFFWVVLTILSALTSAIFTAPHIFTRLLP